MNVIIINDSAHINGGAAKVAIQQAAGLADRGHRVYFVCAVSPVAAELLHDNITVLCSRQHDLLANPSRLQAFIQGWWNSTASRIVYELLGVVHPGDTIIHLHTWRALSASTIRSACGSAIPVLCTLHDFQLACPNGTFFNHSTQQICELRPLSSACVQSNCDTRSYGQKLWRVGRQLIQQELGWAPSGIQHFIAHSQLANQIMRPYLPLGYNIHHLPIYIESALGRPINVEDNEGLVYLGRLVREKGVVLAARSAAAENFPITFVGDGPMSAEIRAANPSAVITGWVDQAGSLEHLRAARALIFPSLWHETLGLVVLEAAAVGIPAIVPDTSGAAELVLDGTTGLHFKSGDEDDLRERMNQLRDRTFVRRLGRNAHEHFWASDYGSLDIHLSSLERIYLKILQQQPTEAAIKRTSLEVQSVGQ